MYKRNFFLLVILLIIVAISLYFANKVLSGLHQSGGMAVLALKQSYGIRKKIHQTEKNSK
ncbi:hypothetical protein [Sporolactobacillus pectinivorans]|uniref:hypothetical protein n=1 Tax=Sporolactobacillus pectinivorans TaxID=1591408 RepID=UPI000C25D609|nr:hypothetical protein [Sporolactobacillus pectinivorans]